MLRAESPRTVSIANQQSPPPVPIEVGASENESCAVRASARETPRRPIHLHSKKKVHKTLFFSHSNLIQGCYKAEIFNFPDISMTNP